MATGARFPFIIIRLWPQHHRSEAELRELLSALRRHRRACDEVWFATEIGFPPLEEHARSARLMAAAAEEIRALGIEPGLQIANTLGHGLNLLADDSGAEWPMMVDADGRTAPPAPCPRSPEMLAYNAQLARLYAAWGPSSIWIDDDLRMSSHGALGHGCFCPACLRAFSAEQGRKHTRRSLVAELHRPAAGALRLAWTRFGAASLAGIAGAIAGAVHAVAPECRLGFQQIGHEQFMYSGPDWSPVLEALARRSRHPARARLGHGYYTDHSPRGMVGKAFMISRQVSRLPKCVDQVCPEIEGFNHNALGKTAHGLAVESTLDLAMGCNSLSYAILCSGHEPMSWYETLLARIAEHRPFWEGFLQASAGTTPGGLEVRLGMEHVARATQPGEKPFAWSTVNLDRAYNLACLGLPLGTSARGASAVLLPADAVPGLSDRELRQVLSGGVMMDGLAAMRVQERGLGRWLGVRVEPTAAPLPFRERMTGDRLNGAYAGRHWDSMGGPAGAFMLEAAATASGVRALGHYEDRLGAVRGLATVLARNRAGGRVAVFGYFGWESAPSGAKRNQYLAAADWASGGRLPAIIEEPVQVMAVPRLGADGRLATLFLLNASIDRTPAFRVRLRRPRSGRVEWVTPGRAPVRLAVERGRGEVAVRVPPMAAWTAGYLRVR
ncbi:MAG TPA: hypothetical protein PK280_06890 [Planctomycetota bacterium]|nr:hypothetical protein [Planctomycetota bacterium]